MTAGEPSPLSEHSRTPPAEVVCVALLVALVVLAARIAAFW